MAGISVTLKNPGTLDASFGTGGKFTASIGDGNDASSEPLLLPGGKILLVGEAEFSGDLDFALVRLNANGTLDTSFGTGGKATAGFGAGDDDGIGTLLQPDGKVVVVGAAHTSPTTYDLS